MFSSKTKIDLKSSKKEIKDYQDSINDCTKRNKELDNEIEDLKTTLKLNQNICLELLINTLGESDPEIINLFKENENLMNENEKLINKNSKTEQKNAILKEKMNTTPTEIQNKIEELSLKNDKLQNELINKDNEIQKLKFELLRTREKSLFKNAKVEVFVVDPTSNNVCANDEIISNKILIREVCKMARKEKNNNEEIKKEIEELQNKLKEERQSGNKQKKTKNIPKKGIIKTAIKKYPKKMTKFFQGIKTELGKGKKDETNEEEEEEQDNFSFKSNDKSSEESNELNEEEEDHGSLDDDLDFLETGGSKGKPKSNKKIFDLICKEYNKLYSQNEELEQRIQKQKNFYFQLRNKVLKMYESSTNKFYSHDIELQSTDEKTEDKKP